MIAMFGVGGLVRFLYLWWLYELRALQTVAKDFGTIVEYSRAAEENRPTEDGGRVRRTAGALKASGKCGVSVRVGGAVGAVGPRVFCGKESLSTISTAGFGRFFPPVEA